MKPRIEPASATPALTRSARAAGETNASSSQKSWPVSAGQAAASSELERALRIEAEQRAVRAEAEAERAKVEADRERRRRIDVEM